MANLVQNEMAAALSEIISDSGHAAAVVWKGNPYDCIMGEPDVSFDMETGGFMPDGSFVIKIARSAFNNGAGPFPQHNDAIEVDGEPYKVTAPRNRPGSPFIRLTIEP